jgi:cytochrome c-type biogenesis protein CcmH
MWRAAWGVACLGMLAGGAARAGAQVAPSGPAAVPASAPPSDSALDARTADVASHLRCPICQGLSIQDSPSQLAQQMRALVREQLAAGKSPSEVRAYFVSRYGEWILLEPRPVGFNLTVYAIPVVAVLAGLALITVAVRRWTRQPAAPS